MKKKHIIILIVCIIAAFTAGIYTANTATDVFVDIDTLNTHSSKEEAYATLVKSILTEQLQTMADISDCDVQLKTENSNIHSVTVYLTCDTPLDAEIENEMTTYISGATNLPQNNISIVYN